MLLVHVPLNCQRSQLTWVAVSGAGLFSLIFLFPSVYYFRETLALSLCLCHSLPTLTRGNQKATAAGKPALALPLHPRRRSPVASRSWPALCKNPSFPREEGGALGAGSAAQGEEERGLCADATQKPRSREPSPAAPRPSLRTRAGRAPPARPSPSREGRREKSEAYTPALPAAPPLPGCSRLGSSSWECLGGTARCR